MSRSENRAAPKLFALEIEVNEEIEAAVFLSDNYAPKYFLQPSTLSTYFPSM